MKEKEDNEKEIYNLFYEQRNEEICSSTFMDSNKERNIIGKEKVYFTKIDYSERKKVNVESIKKLMDLTIEQLCQLKTSSKYSIFDEKNNHECLEIIRKDLKEEFINMKISDFYQNYYLCEDEEYLKKEFGISSKTKNFKCFLDNNSEDYLKKKAIYESGINLVKKFIKKQPFKK